MLGCVSAAGLVEFACVCPAFVAVGPEGLVAAALLVALPVLCLGSCRALMTVLFVVGLPPVVREPLTAVA